VRSDDCGGGDAGSAGGVLLLGVKKDLVLISRLAGT
jgi:hypothetical protein